jgi:hypothetical protein
MSSLAVTEALFQDYVLGTDARITAEIHGPDEGFRAARLAIYRDAYRLRLIEVLGSDYEALKAHCRNEFDALAAQYLEAHPSTFRNVRWFGEKLADFLRSDPRYADRPLLADLARFEWTLGLAFDAPDLQPVTFEQVTATPAEHWPGLRFEPHPSLRVVCLRTGAVALWSSIQAGRSPAGQPGADEGSADWAIWRKALSPYFRSLDKDEAWALGALRAGSSFGELCAGLCDWLPEADAAPRAAQLLRGWVEEGWIAALRTP